MKAGITSFLGIRSSIPEISDDEGSDASDYNKEPTETETKPTAKKAVDNIMIESDDDEEEGEDELVIDANAG